MEENGGAQAQEGVADMKTHISVQERLKDLRVEKGLKLEELAEQVGLSKSALCSYENDEDKEINHGSLLKLAGFYQVTVDYLLGLTDNRTHENTPLAELHLTDEAVALLKSGRVNNRLLCEMMAHKDFVRLLADIEIYVDRVASMQVQSLNAYVDVVRQEIIDRYQPGEDDPHLRVLRAAHLDEDEYFSQLVSEDLRRVIQDIRAAHKGDSESAPVNTVARRRAQTGGTSKSAPTGRSKYSGKYILTNLMFCGHCGTGYRRCVWNKGGVKRAVWRCGSRLDYGSKYCKHSETLEEKPLQQAILNAINSVMGSREELGTQLLGAMEQELAPIPGETMSLADIDRMLEELEKQFNSLLAEASAAGGTEDYAERFRMISNTMADLKEHKARIKQVHQENELLNQRLKAASMAMSAYSAELTEWDQSVVYQLVEKVTALAKDKIRVTFRDGTEVEQEIEQLDWRNAS